LRIREIAQDQLSSGLGSSAHLAVRIANLGTAPTWVYDIACSNLPQSGTADGISEHRHISYLKRPAKIENSLIYPGEERLYVELHPSLLLNEGYERTCGGAVESTMRIGTGAGSPIEVPLRVHLDGNAVSVGSLDDFVCSDITIERLGAE
jgi:hypothetical protein